MDLLHAVTRLQLGGRVTSAVEGVDFFASTSLEGKCEHPRPAFLFVFGTDHACNKKSSRSHKSLVA